MDGRPTPGIRGARAPRVAGFVVLIGAGAAAMLYLAAPLLLRAAGSVVTMAINACVSIALSISVGVSLWTLAGTVGRTVALSLVTPGTSAGLGALVIVAALAAYGLNRLLGAEEESSR